MSEVEEKDEPGQEERAEVSLDDALQAAAEARSFVADAIRRFESASVEMFEIEVLCDELERRENRMGACYSHQPDLVASIIVSKMTRSLFADMKTSIDECLKRHLQEKKGGELWRLD